jgi:FlaA1/EpsC-like NDP-sugar epimerase
VVQSSFTGKNILITGGTGTVGSAIVAQLFEHDPQVIRIYSRDEAKQYELHQKLGARTDVRFLIGDVRDKSRLSRAMEDVDIVFHTAALKHVESCEYNPFEALKTNVVGTQNVIEVALEHDVSRVVFTSTDKAVNPSSAMGATKLMAEKLMVAANQYTGKHRTIFSTVRFGNVLGSRGSVVQLFEDQIRSGGPVTVTDPQMTRFVMSVDHAISLVLDVAKIAVGGEIFVLKMPAVRVLDLVHVLMEEINRDEEMRARDVRIQYIGCKPGEKIAEELMTADESKRAVDLGSMFVIIPPIQEFRELYYPYPQNSPHPQEEYTSVSAEPLDQLGLKHLLGEYLSQRSQRAA